MTDRKKNRRQWADRNLGRGIGDWMKMRKMRLQPHNSLCPSFSLKSPGLSRATHAQTL